MAAQPTRKGEASLAAEKQVSRSGNGQLDRLPKPACPPSSYRIQVHLQQLADLCLHTSLFAEALIAAKEFSDRRLPCHPDMPALLLRAACCCCITVEMSPCTSQWQAARRPRGVYSELMLIILWPTLLTLRYENLSWPCMLGRHAHLHLLWSFNQQSLSPLALLYGCSFWESSWGRALETFTIFAEADREEKFCDYMMLILQQDRDVSSAQRAA